MLAHALIVLLSSAPAGADQGASDIPPPPPPSAVQPAADAPPAPAPEVAAPLPPPPAVPAPAHPRLMVSPEHQALMARRTLLEDEMPTIRRPMWMMIGSAGLGAASVLMSVQFAQSGGFVALSQSPDPWTGISQIVGIVLTGAGHAILGILGSVQMNKAIKQRDAAQRELSEVEAQLATMPPPPPQLVPTL
jgi:hypothetical protein